MNAPPDKIFWLEDGRSLKNTEELRNALKTMSTNIYKHHVHGKHNHFADWVEHVFGKKELAKRMRAAKTRKELINAFKATAKPSPKEKRVKPTKELPLDEKYTVPPEHAHPHIAMVTHIALGVVIGSALTILILTL